MKRIATIVAGLALAMPMAAHAQSAKNSVQIADYVLVPETDGFAWTTVLDTTLKTSEQKDLVIGVSLETGLFTQTQVRTKGAGSSLDTSWAESSVVVRVIIDKGTANERRAFPATKIVVPTFGGGTVELDGVVFDRRGQQLQAVLGFGLTGCTDVDGNGTISPTECTGVTEQMVDLALRTLAAHSFTFALDDLGSGVHTIDVEATVITDKGCAEGQCSAAGLIGRGTVTVEEVRFVKGLDLTR